MASMDEGIRDGRRVRWRVGRWVDTGRRAKRRVRNSEKRQVQATDDEHFAVVVQAVDEEHLVVVYSSAAHEVEATFISTDQGPGVCRSSAPSARAFRLGIQHRGVDGRIRLPEEKATLGIVEYGREERQAMENCHFP